VPFNFFFNFFIIYIYILLIINKQKNKIKNHKTKTFEKGMEKGFFLQKNYSLSENFLALARISSPNSLERDLSRLIKNPCRNLIFFLSWNLLERHLSHLSEIHCTKTLFFNVKLTQVRVDSPRRKSLQENTIFEW